MSAAQITALDNAKIATNGITGAVTGLDAAALNALAAKALDIANNSLTGNLALTSAVSDADITALLAKYSGTTGSAVISSMSAAQITALDNAKIAASGITGAVTGLDAAALTALATKKVDIADASLTGDLAVANADFAAFLNIQSKLATTANVAISAVADGDTVTLANFNNNSFTGTIAGTTGKFYITATGTGQTITTANGDDIIVGGIGADHIRGGGGNDDLSSGDYAGGNHFYFEGTAAGNGHDTIHDFKAGLGGDVLNFGDLMNTGFFYQFGCTVGGDFQTQSVFIFDATPVSIAAAAAAIAADGSVNATKGLIILQNGLDVDIYHTDNAANNGIETLVATLIGINTSDLDTTNLVY